MTDLFERFVESGQAAHAAVDQVLAGPKFIAGVDPGLDGAIVLLPGDANLSPIKFVMPTIEVKIKTGPKKGKSKRLYDLTDIRRILVEHNIVQVFIETQQAQTKPEIQRCKNCSTIVTSTTPQGIVSTFTTGRGFGQLEGLCAGIPISYELVHPRSWQPKMLPAGQGDTKARAVLAAKRLFPSFDLRAHDGCRVPHKGIPDALLIAEFGRRRLGGDIAPEDELLGF
jgi:hypothetical protein